MKHFWTVKQYAIYRIFFGSYLLTHFLWLLPWSTELFSHQGMIPDGSLSPLFSLFPNLLLLSDSPVTVHILLTLALLSSVHFILGKKDRLAAVVIWYVLTAFFCRNPFIANPSLPYVGWLLLAHAAIPKKGNMPSSLFLAAWIAMAVGYSYSGYTKLTSPSWIDGTALYHVLCNPLARVNLVTNMLLALPAFVMKYLAWVALGLELLFAPLVLIRQLRPWIWLLMLLMHFSLLFSIRFADLSFGMIMLHFFTFNPAWIRPKEGNITVFYDGSCGLCHGFVRFILGESVQQKPYLFAPLGGELYQEAAITSGPDSIVVWENGVVLYKIKAVIRILEGLGGLWRLIAFLLKVLPTGLGNLGYDLMASIRHKIFKKPSSACPLVPAEWRQFIVN